jgi:hypothetical protein
MLALHLLQVSLVYVNTLMIQQVLAEPAWRDVIKKVTYAMGIKPCAGCEKRAAALNRWMRFTR